MTELMGSEKAEDLNKAIKEHVDKVVATEGAEIETKEREQIVEGSIDGVGSRSHGRGTGLQSIDGRGLAHRFRAFSHGRNVAHGEQKGKEQQENY